MGDRVVVPLTISCGESWFCQQRLFPVATAPIPTRTWRSRSWDNPLRGCSASPICSGLQRRPGRISSGAHGRWWTDQSSRKRHRRTGPFLSDIFPTGYMVAECAQIERGDTVAIGAAARWSIVAGIVNRDCVGACPAPNWSPQLCLSSTMPPTSYRQDEVQGHELAGIRDRSSSALAA
jgi:hypothetical protein